jgi:hypothetical protein
MTAAAPNVQGSPVVNVPDDGSPATFSWTGGVLAATVDQAQKGAADLVKQQVKSGTINSDSKVRVNPDGSFTLHVSKDVFFQTVNVDATGTLTSVTDAAGNVTTAFTLDGTVDSGGLADSGQITSFLTTWVKNWEAQAQKEPVAPPVQPPAAGGLDF